jgi:hypothetical protein
MEIINESGDSWNINYSIILPIDVTDEGIITDFKEEQPLKELSSSMLLLLLRL